MKMNQSHASINQFWFEFANFFIFNRPNEVESALSRMGYYGKILEMWREQRRLNQYPNGFIEKIQEYKQEIEFLSTEQSKMINNHFGCNVGTEQRAFEDFGQGILFDDRMPVGYKIHMMDVIPVSGTVGATRGYHRWHAFMRASVLLGGDSQVCLRLDRIIALGWAIQSHLKPKQDTQNNPNISEDKLHEFQNLWMHLNFEDKIMPLKDFHIQNHL